MEAQVQYIPCKEGSGVTRLFHLGGGAEGGKGLELGGQAVVTLSKRSATIGWRVAYNKIFAKYTS